MSLCNVSELDRRLVYPFCIFFFNATATTEIYTLSLHDALPISLRNRGCRCGRGRRVTRFDGAPARGAGRRGVGRRRRDRKSTRLNSSHSSISYAVFCLKKKKNKRIVTTILRRNYKPAPRKPSLL